MPYKNKERQKAAQSKWIRAKRLRARLKAEGRIVEPVSNLSPDSVEPNFKDRMRERLSFVRPSNGTPQDDIRAATDRLEAALGGPALVPVDMPELDADGNPIPEY